MARSSRTIAVATVVGTGLAATTSPSRADDNVTVRTIGCRQLDEGEITKLLGIELDERIRRSGRALRVEVDCDGGHLRIVAFDPSTDKRMEREVDFDARQLQRDRVVAILASQLFLSSSSEAPPEADAPISKAPGEAPPAAEVSTRAPSASPPPPRWELAALGGVRVRELSSPLIDGRVSVRLGWTVGPTQLFLDLGAERGSTTRTAGTVVALFVEGSLGARYRAWSHGAFTFDVQAMGGATWVDFQGTDPALGERAAGVSGLAGEASLGIVPGVRLGAVNAGLLLEGGAMLSRARAHVDGDRDVSLAGPWLGAAVTIASAEARR